MIPCSSKLSSKWLRHKESNEHMFSGSSDFLTPLKSITGGPDKKPFWFLVELGIALPMYKKISKIRVGHVKNGHFLRTLDMELPYSIGFLCLKLFSNTKHTIKKNFNQIYFVNCKTGYSTAANPIICIIQTAISTTFSLIHSSVFSRCKSLVKLLLG